MTEARTSYTAIPAARGRNPFDANGVARSTDGVGRYTDLPDSLVHMLRASADAIPATG